MVPKFQPPRNDGQIWSARKFQGQVQTVRIVFRQVLPAPGRRTEYAVRHLVAHLRPNFREYVANMTKSYKILKKILNFHSYDPKAKKILPPFADEPINTTKYNGEKSRSRTEISFWAGELGVGRVGGKEIKNTYNLM